MFPQQEGKAGTKEREKQMKALVSDPKTPPLSDLGKKLLGLSSWK